MVADFKSQIARLEREKEDLKMELSKKVGICTAFIFDFLDAFVCTLHSVVGSFENDFNHFSIFLCWICFDVRKR